MCVHQGDYSPCCYTTLRLSYLPVSLMLIKGIQIGDNEIKVVNFADNTTVFLKDITCLNRIQIILKLYENAKIN